VRLVRSPVIGRRSLKTANKIQGLLYNDHLSQWTSPSAWCRTAMPGFMSVSGDARLCSRAKAQASSTLPGGLSEKQRNSVPE